MSTVRLRAPAEPPPNGVSSAEPLPPLRVSGLVLRKADLIAALRVYVPNLADLAVTEDGEYFWLLLGEGGTSDDPAAS